MRITFRHLERAALPLFFLTYAYAAWLEIAHPSDGVSGTVVKNDRSGMALRAFASGSLTKANPETPPFSCRCRKLPLLRAKDTMPGEASTPGLRFDPAAPAPFCDQTRHNRYLDVSNTREEIRAITNSARSLDNHLTDPCTRPSGQRVPIPGTQRAGVRRNHQNADNALAPPADDLRVSVQGARDSTTTKRQADRSRKGLGIAYRGGIPQGNAIRGLA